MGTLPSVQGMQGLWSFIIPSGDIVTTINKVICDILDSSCDKMSTSHWWYANHFLQQEHRQHYHKCYLIIYISLLVPTHKSTNIIMYLLTKLWHVRQKLEKYFRTKNVVPIFIFIFCTYDVLILCWKTWIGKLFQHSSLSFTVGDNWPSQLLLNVIN